MSEDTSLLQTALSNMQSALAETCGCIAGSRFKFGKRRRKSLVSSH